MNGEVGYYYQAGAHFWIELPVDTRKQGDKPDENA
jgi:hypothetical protein